MRDLYSNVADLCGFVEESTNSRPLVRKATIIAKKRAQDLYLEEVELENDEEFEDDIELDENEEIDIDGDDEEVEVDLDDEEDGDIEARLTKLEDLIEKLSEQIEGTTEDDEEVELELDDEDEDEDEELDIEDEDEDDDLIEGMEINLEGKGNKEESRKRSKARLIKESRKARALDYLKKKKQDLVLESIKLERDSVRRSLSRTTRKPLTRQRSR